MSLKDLLQGKWLGHPLHPALVHVPTGLWPAALGSLSLRRSPCVREHCEACARGDQHSSHVLYCRSKGRRVGIYIPDELVPQIQQALDNGRALQALLYQAGRRYTNAIKHQRTVKK